MFNHRTAVGEGAVPGLSSCVAACHVPSCRARRGGRQEEERRGSRVTEEVRGLLDVWSWTAGGSWAPPPPPWCSWHTERWCRRPCCPPAQAHQEVLLAADGLRPASSGSRTSLPGRDPHYHLFQCSHGRTHTHRRTHTQSDRHRRTHTRSDTHRCTHTRSDTHRRTHTRSDTQGQTHTDVHTHGRTHTDIHTHSRTHTVVHTWSDTQSYAHSFIHTCTHSHI